MERGLNTFRGLSLAYQDSLKSPGTGSPSGFQPSSSPPGLRPGVFARRRWRPFGQVLEPCRTHELDFSDGTPSRGGSSLFPYQISAESLDQDANRIVRLHIYSRPGLETKSCDCDTSSAKSLSAPFKEFYSLVWEEVLRCTQPLHQQQQRPCGCREASELRTVAFFSFDLFEIVFWV